MLTHYLHIYADGAWQLPVAEHIQALTESGLITVLDAKRVGIVGATHNRDQVKATLADWDVIAEADKGYEQVTLNAMKWCPEDKILYTHTKGAYDNSYFRHEWRRAMNACVITRWKRCLEALDSVDAVGAYWREYADIPFHFAGNFWWTKGEYLDLVPFPLPDISRWDAEFLPFQQVRRVLDLHTGPPINSNWAHRRYTTPPPPGFVRFVSFSKILEFKPGRAYEVPITPMIENILNNGIHFQYLPFRDEEYERIYTYDGSDEGVRNASNFQMRW